MNEEEVTITRKDFEYLLIEMWEFAQDAGGLTPLDLYEHLISKKLLTHPTLKQWAEEWVREWFTPGSTKR